MRTEASRQGTRSTGCANETPANSARPCTMEAGRREEASNRRAGAATYDGGDDDGRTYRIDLRTKSIQPLLGIITTQTCRECFCHRYSKRRMSSRKKPRGGPIRG